MSNDKPPPGSLFALLERLATAVLLLVLAALGWILLAAYWPLNAATQEAEVVVVLVLLTAALVLVSVVALVHTR